MMKFIKTSSGTLLSTSSIREIYTREIDGAVKIYAACEGERLYELAEKDPWEDAAAYMAQLEERLNSSRFFQTSTGIINVNNIVEVGITMTLRKYEVRLVYMGVGGLFRPERMTLQMETLGSWSTLAEAEDHLWRVKEQLNGGD